MSHRLDNMLRRPLDNAVMTNTTVTLDQFRELAQDRRVIPVIRFIPNPGLHAVELYQMLAQQRPGTFLLESAEHGLLWSRYSFIGVNTSGMLTEVDGQAHWSGEVPVDLNVTGNPLDVLRDLLTMLNTPDVNSDLGDHELPPLTGGVVGYLGYDVVRRFEKIPDDNPDVLNIPELAMFVATDLAVIDHQTDTICFVANAINYDNTAERVDQAWENAVARLDQMEQTLADAPRPVTKSYQQGVEPVITRETTSDDYQAAVEVAKEHIRAGDAFQIVLSQRFSTPCNTNALDVYQVLRATNPSPYMFLIRVPKPTGPGQPYSEEVAFDLVGSSPEALVRLTDGAALLHPIAGTRPRGASEEDDIALAQDLLDDKKERAEHLMLVDLGRNDLGRVCEPGTVDVIEFMHIERYSHVMHIVSTVVGQISPDMHPLDLVRATFPAGTLSGAPKPMAMQIIEKLEPSRRGFYGGCVGYFDFAGNVDTAIAIRSAVVKDDIAYVQAGAGIVADSVPASEDAECQAKAAAVLRAVASAQTAK